MHEETTIFMKILLAICLFLSTPAFAGMPVDQAGKPVETQPEPAKHKQALSADLLRALKHEDLYGNGTVLLASAWEVLDRIPGDNYEARELTLLERIPVKLGRYYLIFRFDGLWGNGGMQAVTLDLEYPENRQILEATAEAFAFYGSAEAAALIRELIPVAVATQKTLDGLIAVDAPETAFEKAWATIDAFDPRYDRIQFDVYQAILDDLQAHPEDYLINR